VCAPALTASESIDISVAGLYVGETKVVEAAVTATDHENNVVRLRLGAPPHVLVVSLVQGLMSDFPPSPEQYYAGKTVRVAGMIRSFRGELEITLHSSADIQIVEPGVAPGHNEVQAPAAAAPTLHTPPAAANATTAIGPAPVAPAPVAAPSNVQLQQLEQRVHTLEGAVSAPPIAATPAEDSTKLRQLEQRLQQLEAAAQARAQVTPTAVPDAAAQQLQRIEERLQQLEAAEAHPAPESAGNPPAESPHAPGNAPDDDLDLRLRKIEIRLRHIEQAGKTTSEGSGR